MSNDILIFQTSVQIYKPKYKTEFYGRIIFPIVTHTSSNQYMYTYIQLKEADFSVL